MQCLVLTETNISTAGKKEEALGFDGSSGIEAFELLLDARCVCIPIFQNTPPLRQTSVVWLSGLLI